MFLLEGAWWKDKSLARCIVWGPPVVKRKQPDWHSVGALQPEQKAFRQT